MQISYSYSWKFPLQLESFGAIFSLALPVLNSKEILQVNGCLRYLRERFIFFIRIFLSASYARVSRESKLFKVTLRKFTSEESEMERLNFSIFQ